MTVKSPFMPSFGQGATVAPSGTSASSIIGNGSKTLLLSNLSATEICYVRVGQPGIVATTADLPVLPNRQIAIQKAHDEFTVAYISGGGTGNLHILPGEGYLF